MTGNQARGGTGRCCQHPRTLVLCRMEGRPQRLDLQLYPPPAQGQRDQDSSQGLHGAHAGECAVSERSTGFRLLVEYANSRGVSPSADRVSADRKCRGVGIMKDKVNVRVLLTGLSMLGVFITAVVVVVLILDSLVKNPF